VQVAVVDATVAELADELLEKLWPVPPRRGQRDVDAHQSFDHLDR
jgi:hypothetical protein